MRIATLVLDAVTVICPTCGEALPEPTTGSEMWTADDLRRHASKNFNCVCGERVRIASKPTVRVW